MSRKRKVPQKYLDGDTESGGNALIQGKEIALGERIFQLDDDQSQLDVPFDKHSDLDKLLHHFRLAKEVVLPHTSVKRVMPDNINKTELSEIYRRLCPDGGLRKLFVPANFFDDAQALLNPDDSWVHGDTLLEDIDRDRLLMFCDVDEASRNRYVSFFISISLHSPLPTSPPPPLFFLATVHVFVLF